MNLGRYKQHPADVRRRMLDYTDFLESGETITGVAPTVSPTTDTPLVVGNVVIDSGGKKFAYRVSGGEDGISYSVTMKVTTTSQVKNDDVDFDIEVDE